MKVQADIDLICSHMLYYDSTGHQKAQYVYELFFLNCDFDYNTLLGRQQHYCRQYRQHNLFSILS